MQPSFQEVLALGAAVAFGIFVGLPVICLIIFG